jgi:hypothetical protein
LSDAARVPEAGDHLNDTSSTRTSSSRRARATLRRRDLGAAHYRCSPAGSATSAQAAIACVVLEKTLSEILARHSAEVWPDLDLTFVERERRLAGGQILDHCYRDLDGTYVIVELKRNAVTASTIAQVVGYLHELRLTDPAARYRAMAVAPKISRRGQAAADAAHVDCRTIDIARLTEIAARHGLPTGHASNHRPAARRPPITSRPRTTPRHRPATPTGIVGHLRVLDERFPPGTLTSTAALETLIEYWRHATPTAPKAQREIAARLTHAVLQTLPGAAVSTRSGGTIGYTTIRALDGRVGAALDARLDHTKFDFPLPERLARQCRDAGLLKIWQPRGYSLWCQSRVGVTLTLEHATQLLRTGLRFEFDIQ